MRLSMPFIPFRLIASLQIVQAIQKTCRDWLVGRFLFPIRDAEGESSAHPYFFGVWRKWSARLSY